MPIAILTTNSNDMMAHRFASKAGVWRTLSLCIVELGVAIGTIVRSPVD
jgi:hypothetical protein